MLKITTRLSTLLLLLVFTLSATAQDSPSPAKIYNNALAKMKEKAYEEAFPMFLEAIEKADSTKETDLKVVGLASKNGASCAYRIGAAARKAKEYDKALEHFDKGIELNPDNFGNYLGRAQALDGIGEDQNAALAAYIAAADKAQASSSEKQQAQAPKLYSKAQKFSQLAYVKAKDYEKSVELADAYLTAREEANDGYIANYYKAASLNKLEKNEDALPAIQASVAALPEGEDADKYHLLHGLVNQALGKSDEAIAAYEMVKGEKYKAAAQSRISALKQ